MEADIQAQTNDRMGKIIVYAIILSTVVAAYFMNRRRESLLSIAKQAVTDPVCSMVSEAENAV